MNRPVNILGRMSVIDVLLTVAEDECVMLGDLRDTEARMQYRTAVTALEDAGLVTRSKSSEDLRYTFVQLTPLGHAVTAYLQEIDKLMGGEQ